jgi:uncharacterized protein YcbK (DUF882 family)
MKLTRRQLLTIGGAAAASAVGGIALPRAARAEPMSPSVVPTLVKRISLYNLHTNEHLEPEFYRGAEYVPETFAAIQVFLRDFRNGEQHVIDPKLMDYLYDVAARLGVDPVFSVISGYRSPRTNALLHERSSGVARHSLHLEGRAIDVRLAGVDCATLATHALDMTRGGVGYYRQSDFVHLDTGAFRTWKG